MATHSTEESIVAGLDQEMPFGLHYSEAKLMAALEAGSIQESSIDSSVLNILTAMYTIGLFDHKPTGDPLADVTSPEHSALAREIVAKSTVLLKNKEKLLPIVLSAESTIKTIAVIGDQSIVSGTGSGKVEPAYVVTPSEGITAAVRAGGYDGDVNVVYNDGSDLRFATELASSADIVIVLVATTSGEASDRSTLSLGETQNDLVWAIAEVNSNTVVAVTTPGACLMPWADDVSSIVVSWLPGQEAGNGLADVLFGAVNPSARLHVTIPNKDNELEFTDAQYPGEGFPPEANYSEGLLVGYRYYEAKSIDPKFPFGHGLSYTSFQYSDIAFDKASGEGAVAGTVSVTVTNTGDVFGDEIAQLYITFPGSAGEPPNQLKAFSKFGLNPAESKTAVFELKKSDLSIWNQNSHAWQLISGEFKAKSGGSSRDVASVETSFVV